MVDTVTPETQEDRVRLPHASLFTLGLGALGVVFGDIGTSPLYAFKAALDVSGTVDPGGILGMLSLIFWTLILTTSIKYVAFVMQVDNDGEGGILALMSLLGVKRGERIAVITIGLFGAALLYGDGAITPAISVLSALEGLKLPFPAIAPYIVPVAVAILIGLFAIQSQGTDRIGRLFGPIMGLWFLALALMGLRGIMFHPAVLAGFSPLYGLDFLFHNGMKGFLALGAVFLCATGAEALYADMGHFGARPIRLAWWMVVLPALMLNYAGMTALALVGGVPQGENPFFMLCPDFLRIPLVLLATAATIIASQAIISGVFSMTRQAIQLGWCPRLVITQTSAHGYGQIYVGVVNWSLMVLTLVLTIGFGTSDNLAAAYGIAVVMTMVLTTGLLFLAMQEIWHWPPVKAGLVAGLFLIVDLAFTAANLAKIVDGGWVPLLTGFIIYGLMQIWHRGSTAVMAKLKSQTMPVEAFLDRIKADHIPRVPGTAVFLTKTTEQTPPLLLWHVRHNRALHRQIVAVTIRIAPVPWVAAKNRRTVESLGENFWRISARYGFMERLDIPLLLAGARSPDCRLDLRDTVYYVGHETILSRPASIRNRMPAWQVKIYATMERNAAHVSDFFNLPRDKVVEIGRQIEI